MISFTEIDRLLFCKLSVQSVRSFTYYIHVDPEISIEDVAHCTVTVFAWCFRMLIWRNEFDIGRETKRKWRGNFIDYCFNNVNCCDGKRKKRSLVGNAWHSIDKYFLLVVTNFKRDAKHTWEKKNVRINNLTYFYIWIYIKKNIYIYLDK